MEYLKLKPDGLIFYLREACPNPNMPGELTPLRATPGLGLPPTGASWSSASPNFPSCAQPCWGGGSGGSAPLANWASVPWWCHCPGLRAGAGGGTQFPKGFGAPQAGSERDLIVRQQENPCPGRLGPAGSLNAQNQGGTLGPLSQMSLQSLPCPEAQLSRSLPQDPWGGTFPEKIWE